MSDEPKLPRRWKQLREEITDVLADLGAPSPQIQMAYYSVGLNPSGKKDHFFDLLKMCGDRQGDDGLPQAEDWERLIDYYRANPELHGGFVSQEVQFKATSDMMPYLFPKLKSVHVSGELEHLVKVVPLTPEDIARMEAHLVDEF